MTITRNRTEKDQWPENWPILATKEDRRVRRSRDPLGEFLAFGLLAAALAILCSYDKRSVAEKGAPVAAE